jgi:diguanylate cyclase (GGDEF)-like protein
MHQEAVRALLRAADTRDETSHARDLAGTARDHAADERDLAMERREDDDAHDAAAQAAAVAGIVRRGVNRRERGAAARSRALDDRRLAAGDRGLAAVDRQDAGLDREQAVGEQLLAARNRDTLERHLAIAETDPLTGARARGAGLTALEQEVDRCRRTGGLLVVAYVDVVGLKALNDAAGHPAGDELLKRVAVLITQNLRSFDLIIRMGGDEFLCAMSNATLPDARRRFRAIDAALTITPGTHAINAGYAELAADDTVAKLIARADGDLLEGRRANPDSRH